MSNAMSKRILVTYASRTGSTVGVAKAIGEALAGGGATIEVMPMSDVNDLTPYTAVVAGSGIQGAKWLPEAIQFVEAHRAELARRPFAAFLVCMTMAMPGANAKYREHVQAMLAPVRELVRPVSEGLFAGALDTKQIKSLRDRLLFRASVLMGVWKEGDHRDWAAIHAWAESLRPMFAE